MPDSDQHDMDYNKKREAVERQASALANDKTAKTAHKTLAVLYGDRVIDARLAINAGSARKPDV